MNDSSLRTPIRSSIRLAVQRCHVFAFGLLLGLPAAAPCAEVTWPPPESIEQQAERTVRLIERLEELVPQPPDDMTDRAFALDFDIGAAALLPPPSDRRVAFRSGPMVAGRRTGTLPNGALKTHTDILWNPSTSLVRMDDDSIRLDTAGAIGQGVRETLVESMIAGVHPGWSARTPRSLVDSEQALAKQDLSSWPDAARTALLGDLDDGYLVAIADDPGPHWWRIDPVTGQTLGMSPVGGSEIMEYLITTAGIAISVALFANSVESCDEQYADNQAMADCCIVGNLGATYLTSGASAAGAAATTTGNALYAATGSIKSTLGWTAADIGAGLGIGAVDGVGAFCRAYLGQN